MEARRSRAEIGQPKFRLADVEEKTTKIALLLHTRQYRKASFLRFKLFSRSDGAALSNVARRHNLARFPSSSLLIPAREKRHILEEERRREEKERRQIKAALRYARKYGTITQRLLSRAESYGLIAGNEQELNALAQKLSREVAILIRQQSLNADDEHNGSRVML